jgi:hypothetical protein
MPPRRPECGDGVRISNPSSRLKKPTGITLVGFFIPLPYFLLILN